MYAWPTITLPSVNPTYHCFIPPKSPPWRKLATHSKKAKANKQTQILFLLFNFFSFIFVKSARGQWGGCNWARLCLHVCAACVCSKATSCGPCPFHFVAKISVNTQLVFESPLLATSFSLTRVPGALNKISHASFELEREKKKNQTSFPKLHANCASVKCKTN